MTSVVRVTVPVRPEVLEGFKELASCMGCSTGKAMGEWLADTLEAAKMMAATIEAARQRPQELAQSLMSAAQALDVITDDAILKARGATAAMRQKAIHAASGGASPPDSNTGGKGSRRAKK